MKPIESSKYNQSTLQDIIVRDNNAEDVLREVKKVYPDTEDIFMYLISSENNYTLGIGRHGYGRGGIRSSKMRDGAIFLWFPNHRPYSFINEETWVVGVQKKPACFPNLREALIYSRLAAGG